MNLTNEEKKKIGDSVTAMMQAFCEFKMAEDRLKIANDLSANLVKIKLPDDIINAILKNYLDSFKQKQLEFFDALGISFDNKEFWDWYDKQPPSMDELKKKVENS